jgi:alkanesulfonate monooxygenase SsuD/methylene tetrahydromethanopterin reductase-like flavin-dependent oxidoreductase (luciferase family)
MQIAVPETERLHLAVALDGAGWHPAAWREPDARPAELLTAAYWADLVAEAERGRLDFVTFEDALSLQSDDRFQPDRRTDRVRGRLVADRVDTQFVGSPKQVAGELEQLRDATGADELIITTITHDHADRMRSYELLAEEWTRR